MKNVYDIRYEKNLIYILDEKNKAEVQKLSNDIYKKTAVIVYLYYEDTLQFYYPYLERIQQEIDVFIISSREDVLEKVREYMEEAGKNHFTYLLKENRGRDVSALLVTAADIIGQYEYVCFLHDKKEHCQELKEDTELWKRNLWENLLANSIYIDKILTLMQCNRTLGVLAPPEPIGDYFCTWYGYGWHGSFDVTKTLMQKLNLKANLDKEKPPITVGTALWFKTTAMKKLFSKKWIYEDFDDNGLKTPAYLSYGVERIFAYVAQDAGYDTGNIMTISYAQIQTNYLQYSTKKILREMECWLPYPSVNRVMQYRNDKERIIEFAKKNKNVYLYGNGERAKICCFLLMEENLLPKGYLVTQKDNEMMEKAIPVYALSEFRDSPNSAIIITVASQDAREEIKRNLENLGMYNYIQFME